MTTNGFALKLFFLVDILSKALHSAKINSILET